MSCHGYDGDMSAVFLFPNTDGHRCIQSIHFGHLYIHSHKIELSRFNGTERFAASANNGNLVAQFFKDASGHQLVDVIVFRYQHMQLALSCPHLFALTSATRTVRERLPDDTDNCIKEFRLLDWLGETGGDFQFAATIDVPRKARRREDNDLEVRVAPVLRDLTG